jgi:hypothetical protein
MREWLNRDVRTPLWALAAIVLCWLISTACCLVQTARLWSVRP